MSSCNERQRPEHLGPVAWRRAIKALVSEQGSTKGLVWEV